MVKRGRGLDPFSSAKTLGCITGSGMGMAGASEVSWEGTSRLGSFGLGASRAADTVGVETSPEVPGPGDDMEASDNVAERGSAGVGTLESPLASSSFSTVQRSADACSEAVALLPVKSKDSSSGKR